MTKPNKTEIIVVLDRSGSMSSIKADMEGGFNTFIEAQKKLADECTVTLVQFDDVCETVYEGKSLNDIPPLKLEPRGWTSLLGAVGQTIEKVGSRLALTPEEQRPSQVLFLIITDGAENCSHRQEWSCKYTSEKVFEAVKHQTAKYNWQFVYIGANQDAIAVGTSLGVALDMNFNYSASAAGVKSMMRDVTEQSLQYRSVGSFSKTK